MHGNDRKNMDDHHLYGIHDREREGIYKYGISGRALNSDGSSPRANEQVNLFNRVVGWARFFAIIILSGIKGREEAENQEQKYIGTFLEDHGEKPPGNF